MNKKRHVVDALGRMDSPLKRFIKIHNAKEKELKVFLGGTCNESTWRDELIPMLEIPYFNPVVEDWNEEAQEEEKRQKEICAYEVFVITKEMTGVFSIAEVIDAVHRNPRGTIFCYIYDDEFKDHQIKSLQAVGDLVVERGGYFCGDLETVAVTLNQHMEKGIAPILTIPIQSDPIPQVGENGIQATDLLEYTKCLFESLNDRFGCRENSLTITKIEEGLRWQDARTNNRVKRNVEGENKA